MKKWIQELQARSFGKGRYSQGCQDGVLEAIFSEIPTVNAPPFCVEFGFNAASLDGGTGANVARLVLEQGWRCLLLDGGHENPAINLHRRFLTPGNIGDIFAELKVPQVPDYVSIDVDSTDLWIFEALLTTFRASVFSVEYNAHFPIDRAITFPDDPNQFFEDDRGYGASLKALWMVAERHGYSLVYVVPLLDAFFIRNDLIDDGTGALVPSLETWAHCTRLVHHESLRRRRRADIFLDFEVYLATNGDLAASRKAARDISREVLLDPPLLALARRWRRALRRRLKG